MGGLVENVAVMFGGEIVELGPIDKTLFEPLHPYTEMLIDSLLTLDSHTKLDASSESREIFPLFGGGCKFANRCKYAFDKCKVERPLLTKVEGGRVVACHKYN